MSTSVTQAHKPGIIATPDRAELLRRAEEMLPRLRDRALQTERDRRVPDETVADFRSAGFHRVMQPVRFGGYGMGMDVAAEISRTVAMGCGSSGWLVNLFMMHNFQIAHFPIAAQEEYWSGSLDVLASTASFAPRSRMEAVDGGFRISGHWKFSSGCDFADWFIIMKPQSDCLDWMLVPRRDVVIQDDWFVSGLCGTGSRDIVLDDVFVPAHRVLTAADQNNGQSPGGKLHDTPALRLPFPLSGVWGVPSTIIGMAAGMAAAVQKGMVGKRALFSRELQTERPANRMRLAAACADINAAELIMRNRLALVEKLGADRRMPEGAEMFGSHRDAAYVARMMVRTASDLALMAGASGTHLTNPIQRFLRDIMVAGTHISVAWEEFAELYGQAAWDAPA